MGELKHKGVKFEKIETEHVWQHPKNTSAIYVDDVRIGTINTIHPKTMGKIAKNASVVCIEICLDEFDEIVSSDLQFDEPSKFPTIEYDLSLLMPEGVRFENISHCWSDLKLKELLNVTVIDIYDVLPAKSITVRFYFGAEDRTLTSEEVQSSIDKIVGRLKDLKVEMKG